MRRTAPDGQRRLRYLEDPEPLGGPASVPPPRDSLYGTFAGAPGQGSEKGAQRAPGPRQGLTDKVKDAFD